MKKSITTKKLFLQIKTKNKLHCKNLKSKIFYNLTYAYIKNNFSLINKLIKFSSFSNILLMNHYNLMDNIMYNDLFILNYLDNNLNNKMKTMININKNKKPLSIITILKRILFSNKKFFRLIKTEKSFLKVNIYNIFFFLFYYYMTNSLHYVSFLKFNNLKNKKSLFTLNIFKKKNLKDSFKFFFKNIIMFLYKFSLIKSKKQKFFKIFIKSLKKKFIPIKQKYKYNSIAKKKNTSIFFKSKYIRAILNRKRIHLELRLKKLKKKLTQKLIHKLKKRLKNKLTSKLRNKLENKIKIIKSLNKLENKINNKKYKFKFSLKNLSKKNEKLTYLQEKPLKKKIRTIFKNSLTFFLNKKKSIFPFKKLFLKKTFVKRIAELSFKKDSKLKNAASILKNNKKFKFLTFPINSICKFFFKNSMYNIFMTLIVLPLNLTIGNYSGGHFNILSKRRDRGSINSLKSMSKLISLKIYQSNLSFIIFCPRLFTNNNKRLIKTIFYSFKILNRSPITKIYLYRPVIRNGIRSKKIPRK